MNNRKATLEVYTVQKNMSGRKEACWVLDKKTGETLEKQNLILRIWDLENKNAKGLPNPHNAFYVKEFNDVMKIRERVYKIARMFDGTHSRTSSTYTDDASFETRQRGELIKYLEGL